MLTPCAAPVTRELYEPTTCTRAIINVNTYNENGGSGQTLMPDVGARMVWPASMTPHRMKHAKWMLHWMDLFGTMHAKYTEGQTHEGAREPPHK
mmetsp:Transcript_46826/g.107543  ORF Transcript_46826/g.107543 Transcript_46826/m.107543 type:complete len:94 (-) Transcript_46826:531-812(-)